MVLFRHELERLFSREYNKTRNSSGSLFSRPFGNAAKQTAKKLRACILYINDNPVTGKITKEATEYRWSLIAYCNNKNPFSEKIDKHAYSKNMRCAIKIIDEHFNFEKPLKYATQKRIFSRLNEKETEQAVDYILSLYNPIDFKALDQLFGGMKHMKDLMSTSTGSEYDIKEDWEDYSKYIEMLSLFRTAHVSDEIINMDAVPIDERISLAGMAKWVTNATDSQMRKFFHI